MGLYDRIAVRSERSEILSHAGHAVRLSLQHIKGATAVGRSRFFAEYMNANSVRKLQLGSGPKVLDGWLNTDCRLGFPSKGFLDVTQRFPMEDETFDYAFSEHLIEHLTYLQGLAMLRECHRVLKPGGTIRVACPDLRIIVGLCAPEKTEAQRCYIKSMVDAWLPDIGAYSEAFVINNAVRNWGHKFLYDEETLTAALSSAGFTEARRFLPCESDDPNLERLETPRLEDEAKFFETLVIQATKPKRP